MAYCFCPVCLSVCLLSTLTFTITLNHKRQRLHIWPTYYTNEALSTNIKVSDLVTLTLSIDLYPNKSFNWLCCRQEHGVSQTHLVYLITMTLIYGLLNFFLPCPSLLNQKRLGFHIWYVYPLWQNHSQNIIISRNGTLTLNSYHIPVILGCWCLNVVAANKFCTL